MQQSTLFAIWTRVTVMGVSNSRENHSNPPPCVAAQPPELQVPSRPVPSISFDAEYVPYAELSTAPTIEASSSSYFGRRRGKILITRVQNNWWIVCSVFGITYCRSWCGRGGGCSRSYWKDNRDDTTSTALSILLWARLCLFSSAHIGDLLVLWQFSRTHSHNDMDNGVVESWKKYFFSLPTFFNGLMVSQSGIVIPFCLRWETILRQLRLRPGASLPATTAPTTAVGKTVPVPRVTWAWASWCANIGRMPDDFYWKWKIYLEQEGLRICNSNSTLTDWLLSLMKFVTDVARLFCLTLPA